MQGIVAEAARFPETSRPNRDNELTALLGRDFVR